MDLSPHLSLAEFLATAHRGLVDEQLRAWRECPQLWLSANRLAADVFEPARAILGVPMHVTSGYRCAWLNRTVRGRQNSRHVLALAIDVVPLGLELKEAFERIVSAVRAGKLPRVDQAILEMSWIHLQAAAEGDARHACLVTSDGTHFANWT